MKFTLSICLICLSHFISIAQVGYPNPENTDTRLFYIQHSNNHNTYVYDVNLKGTHINTEQPIDEYRILYTENGIKKPLTGLQEKMAYGMKLVNSEPNLLTFQLAATNDLNFYLTQTKVQMYRIYVIVNNHKMYLEKLFVKLKDGFFGGGIDVEFVLFYGTDFNTEKAVIEKFMME